METKWIKQNSIDCVEMWRKAKTMNISCKVKTEEMSWFEKILSLTFQFWPHQSEHARKNKICTSIYSNITSLSPNLNNNEPSDEDVKKAIKTKKKMIKLPLTMKRKFWKQNILYLSSKISFSVSWGTSGIKSTSQSSRLYHVLKHYGNKKVVLKILTLTEVSQLDPLWWK